MALEQMSDNVMTEKPKYKPIRLPTKHMNSSNVIFGMCLRRELGVALLKKTNLKNSNLVGKSVILASNISVIHSAPKSHSF